MDWGTSWPQSLAAGRGRCAPLTGDGIVHAEQRACVQGQVAALCAHRQHVIRVLRGLGQRPTVGLTTAARASMAQEVIAALATRRAVTEAWDSWWTAYGHLLREHPSTDPSAAQEQRGGIQD